MPQTRLRFGVNLDKLVIEYCDTISNVCVRIFQFRKFTLMLKSIKIIPGIRDNIDR
ncbi:MAG: hypothetical protein ACFE9R_14715 [Candidatus Hermodarchaeota archaeon]